MHRLTVISDSPEAARDLAGRLSDYFRTHPCDLGALPETPPDSYILVDVSLRDPDRVSNLKAWLKRRPADAQIIVSIGRDAHTESIQAYAIGATAVVRRPISARLLAWMLSKGGAEALNLPASDATISAGVNALQGMFAAVLTGATPDMQLVHAAGAEVVDRIEEAGLARWLDLVRSHHSQTYQHSLIVTAVAVAFGKHLGFSRADKQRVASAGLLHDVGKAKIPLEILEKPAPLDETETAAMKEHPMFGFEILKDAPGVQPEMLDMVVHHHEYLDGSGYPHGLQANDISDLVRTITIADIYGALIERRSYKPPLPGPEAYRILQGMGPKLDRALVREFRPLAENVY